LTLSKVNTAPIKLAPIDVKDAVRNALLNLDASLKEAQASVVVEALPSILADSTHMTQLFQNLIGNAVKFRSEDDKPVIKVSARRHNLHWLFSVADNGIGISPEYAGRIFLAFQRLHTQSAYSGTGIGLAVCERIVQRHGGKIWVEPGSKGGSVFYFTVPYVHSEKSK
jgi:light-regulated signal transduction histidine kinase (bacteriophytochrome)